MAGRLAMAVFGNGVVMAGCAGCGAAGPAIAGAVELAAGCALVFTVDMPLAFGADVVAGATLEAPAGWPVRLIVLVCRSRSGAGGMARLTD
jgi:hypothetical protein